MLLRGIAELQKEEFAKIKREPLSAVDIEMNRVKNQGKDKCRSNMVVDAIIYGIKLYLIDDVGSGCVPVLEITLEES